MMYARILRLDEVGRQDVPIAGGELSPGRIIYEHAKKTSFTSGIDSHASLFGTVRHFRYRSRQGAEIVEKNGIQLNSSWATSTQ
jgi:hypothetical protein